MQLIAREARGRESVDGSSVAGAAAATPTGTGQTRMVPMEALVVGATLRDAYRLEEVLAQDTSSAVYRAVNTNLGQPVAVKMLPPSLASDVAVVARFKSSVREQAKLRHPNIVGIYDLVLEGDVCAVVMEYVPGNSLGRVLCDLGGPMPFAQVRAYLIPVMQAIAFAHTQGVLHRGIKPSNILLAPFGDRVLPKVSDFGLLRLVSSDPAPSSASALLSALPYLPPELCRGTDRDGDERSDVYSLGVTLYQMVTGRVPFYDRLARSLSRTEPAIGLLLDEVGSGTAGPGAFQEGVPDALRALILKASSADPAQRYPTVSAMADELRAVSFAPPPPVKRARSETPVKRARSETPVSTEAPTLDSHALGGSLSIGTLDIIIDDGGPSGGTGGATDDETTPALMMSTDARGSAPHLDVSRRRADRFATANVPNVDDPSGSVPFMRPLAEDVPSPSAGLGYRHEPPLDVPVVGESLPSLLDLAAATRRVAPTTDGRGVEVVSMAASAAEPAEPAEPAAPTAPTTPTAPTAPSTRATVGRQHGAIKPRGLDDPRSPTHDTVSAARLDPTPPRRRRPSTGRASNTSSASYEDISRIVAEPVGDGWRRAPRLRLRIPSPDRWQDFYDPSLTGGGLFLPMHDPPGVGERVRVEVVFESGPRFFLGGMVIWRRRWPSDPRVRGGAGVQVDAVDAPKLAWISSWLGDVDRDAPEGGPRLPVRLQLSYIGPSGPRVCHTSEIDERAAVVNTYDGLDLDSIVSATVHPPGQGRPLTLRARVARVIVAEKGRAMELRFVEDDERVRQRLTGLIAELEQRMRVGALPDELLG